MVDRYNSRRLACKMETFNTFNCYFFRATICQIDIACSACYDESHSTGEVRRGKIVPNFLSAFTCGTRMSVAVKYFCKLLASTELQAVERFLYVEWLYHFRI